MSRNEAQIDRRELFERLHYEPHGELQWAMHNSAARFRVSCCGRRFGKSHWAGRELVVAMFVPDSYNWIVGPDYSLGEKEFRIVYNDFKTLGLLKYCKTSYNINQGQMRIHFGSEFNSILEVKSAAKPDGLVGEGLDHVCMSEAAKHNWQTWQMYIQPALADKKGSADFPSTPQGYNWYHAMFDMGQKTDKEFKDYESWCAPSWENKIVFPGGRDDDEILRLERDTSSLYFAQEIAAEFTAFEGMIYPDFNEHDHVIDFDYNPLWPNYIALDFGYKDPFVCLDIQVDPTTKRVYVWREYQVSYKATGEHGLYLQTRENPNGYHINSIYADPRGADPIATLIPILGSINAHSVGWDLGVEEIRRALKLREDGRPGLLIDRSCTHLIRQMKGLRKATNRDGHNERAGQHDHDDHGPDALRYFFNEYFVLGGAVGLADVYSGYYQGSESESFFTYQKGLNLIGT